MGSRADHSRGPDPARPAAGRPAGSRTGSVTQRTAGGSAKAAVLLAAVLAAVAALALAVAAPAPAQTTYDAPDYVLGDGTVVIDGDAGTDCASFATFLEQGYFESGDLSAGARRVPDQCEDAGLLASEGTAPADASAGGSATASASAAAGQGEELPETGGPALPVLLVVSGAGVVAGGLLARKVAS